MDEKSDINLNRHSPVPLYAQLAQIVRQRIISGELNAGDKIPTEVELGKQFNLSRNTVRQAIDKLINEGYVYRNHGRGTFVARGGSKIHCHISNLVEHRHLLALEGHAPRYEHISSSVCEADEMVAEKLNLIPGEKVVCAKYIFFADEQPAIFVENYIPAKLVEGQDEYVNSSGDYFYEFVETVTGKTIRHVVADIVPMVAEGEIAEIMKMPVGSPLLQMRELFVDTENQEPLDLGVNYYHPDIIQFSVIRNFS